MDRGFIALLFLTSLTGLALLAWRDTGAMALLLALHLGVVMALFLTLPYGKFAHGVYRSAALLKWAIEKRQPSRLQLGFQALVLQDFAGLNLGGHENCRRLRRLRNLPQRLERRGSVHLRHHHVEQDQVRIRGRRRRQRLFARTAGDHAESAYSFEHRNRDGADARLVLYIKYALQFPGHCRSLLLCRRLHGFLDDLDQALL